MTELGHFSWTHWKNCLDKIFNHQFWIYGWFSAVKLVINLKFHCLSFKYMRHQFYFDFGVKISNLCVIQVTWLKWQFSEIHKSPSKKMAIFNMIFWCVYRNFIISTGFYFIINTFEIYEANFKSKILLSTDLRPSLKIVTFTNSLHNAK